MKICLSLILLIFLASCSRGEKKVDQYGNEIDSRAKSQTRGDIIERSGTIYQAGSSKKAKKKQMTDAKHRLQSGGGLFGKKPSNLLETFKKDSSDKVTTSIGFPVNPYLWRGSLDVISFMPLSSADPFAGIIITDWYTQANDSNQRCRLNIFIKGAQLNAENLKVNSFCQTLNEDKNWVDQKINKNNNTKLENAILNSAKKIRLSQS